MQSADPNAVNFSNPRYNSDLKRYNVQLKDKSYYHTPVDCYELDRVARIFEPNDELSNLERFKYNKPLSEDAQNLLGTIPPDDSIQKFLRIELFMELIYGSMLNNINTSKMRRHYFGDSSSSTAALSDYYGRLFLV